MRVVVVVLWYFGMCAETLGSYSVCIEKRLVSAEENEEKGREESAQFYKILVAVGPNIAMGHQNTDNRDRIRWSCEILDHPNIIFIALWSLETSGRAFQKPTRSC